MGLQDCAFSFKDEFRELSLIQDVPGHLLGNREWIQESLSES